VSGAMEPAAAEHGVLDGEAGSIPAAGDPVLDGPPA